MTHRRGFALRLAGVVVSLGAAASGAAAQTLAVRLHQGRIRVFTEQPQFIQGKPLARLRNGAPVVFSIQLNLLASPRGGVLARSSGRFAVSFDIWEERFAVTRMAHSKKPAALLSAAEAEDWCLETLALPETAVPAEASFWVRLDVRSEEPADASALAEDAGYSLARLVELFARNPEDGGGRRSVEAGPWRLRDLRKGD